MSAAPLALALGSGGARGWCRIGVLREMEAQGARITRDVRGRIAAMMAR